MLGLTIDYKSIIISVTTNITPFLHYIPVTIPEFTDHGILHSTNVLQYIGEIKKEYPVQLSEDELFILGLSASLHDIGCITGRQGHNQKTIKILEKKQFDFLRISLDALDSSLYPSLQQVIISHSSDSKFDSLPSDFSSEIRLKIISPLFRLADACDVTSNRVKRLLFEILVEEKLLNEKEQEIWKSHLAISSIFITKNKIELRISDVKKAKYCIDHLKEELIPINQILSKQGFPAFII